MNDLPKAYDPKNVEDDISRAWEASGYFNPDTLPIPKNAEAFSIVLPPPTVTSTLHLGHAMYVIEDVMIRHARMQGKRTLWLPGMDHAAIATQNKVERIVWDKEKKTRHDLGREELIRRIDAFVADSRSTITNQLKKMGFSLDWSRERFTLDPAISRAVQKMFVDMHTDGLIYRGSRIVNWCPRCQSTLADDEVEYKEERTPFYYFKYGPFSIATVRPETKIGDKVVIVHPKDKRYTKYHGKTFPLPWIDGDIEARVIADEASDPELGSGAMTITPAHSFVDFELAKKYGIEIENIIGQDGRLTNAAGKYAGLTTQEARKKFVEILQKKGLVEKIDENYTHNLTVCYRCGTAVEPLVSPQWFVDVNKPVVTWKGVKKSLKDVAIEVVKSGDIEIIPDRFEKTYFQWIENLHDWCISRQLWYGHRIPVWYCVGDEHEGAVCKLECRQPVVQTDHPIECRYCGSKNLRQDPDTLDTWFSSGMWTFTTLGWPEKTRDLKTFHPTNVLETGYDILFFWVARMILMTTYATGEVPFRTVYLHGLVRDKEGRKMSKSLGNIIDPLDMSAKYGTDALRLALMTGTTPGNDVNLYEEKIAGYRNFVNKFWNIARFILTTVETPRYVDTMPTLATDADRWIISRLHETTRGVNKLMDKYQYGLAIEKLYRFTWNDLADWYLEIAKVERPVIASEAKQSPLLLFILQNLLKLWHPYAPFITEHVYQMLNGHPKNMLMIETWPNEKTTQTTFAHESERAILAMQDIVNAIREKRSWLAIPYTTTLELSGKMGKAKGLEHLIEHFGKVKMVKKPQGKTLALTNGLSLSGFTGVNFEKEHAKTKKELKNLEGYITGLAKKLANEKFTSNAPKNIIEQERAKLEAATERVKDLKNKLKQLT
ncbi:MAG: valine--tRNA ligase [Candidatus Kerfeldbacteria bacterium]|nr:valine--tRNA ligase [Candidatus Kerfeldbacteria bacterium]